MNAHATLEKAVEIGWYGNSRADELATEGTSKHHEDKRAKRVYENKKKLILTTQRYLLRRQDVLVLQQITQEKVKRSEGQIISRRNRKQRGRPKERENMHRHNTVRMEDMEICLDCGRKVRNGRKDQKDKMERRLCPAEDFQDLFDLGHRPRWLGGKWQCSKCDRNGGPLLGTRCDRKTRTKGSNKKRPQEAVE